MSGRARGSECAGRTGSVAVAAVRASEPSGGAFVGRIEGLCGGASAAWRWRGSEGASPVQQLPRALGRTCAVRAAAAAAATLRCARYAVCVIDDLCACVAHPRCSCTV